MPSPLTTLRESRGMTKARFAMALGIPYSTLHAVETGTILKIGRKLQDGLVAIGVDPEAIAEEQAAWLESVRAEAIADAAR